MPALVNREAILLFGGLTLLIALAFVIGRVVRSFDHGFSIRLQLFFCLWVMALSATGLIGVWVIDRLQVHASNLALSEESSVGVVLEILREFGPKITLITALLALGSAGAAYALGRSIATPIERLTQSAEAIAAGERGRTLPTPVGREVRRLTAAFDSMTKALDDRHHVERFVVDLSHELKNPVSAIRAATEVLSEGAGDDPESRARFLARIKEASRRLELLANDLLGLARLEAGKGQGVPVQMDLEDVVRHAVSGQTAALEAKQIKCVVEAEPMSVLGDALWIRRAVDNLLVNAIRYSPDRGQITLSIFREDENAVLRVRDQGPGVASAIRERLFERFATDRGGPEQTGLGLAIVRSVAELHGGRARLVETSAQGAIFEFSVRGA